MLARKQLAKKRISSPSFLDDVVNVPSLSPPAKKRRTLTALDDPEYLDKLAEDIFGSSSSATEDEVYNLSTPSFENLEQETMGRSWYKALSPEFSKPYFQKLKKYIVAESTAYTIYPQRRDIYSWSRLTPLESVKVVILGQDPYHDVNQAHGLAFSVLRPTKPPPSLRNIYKQIQEDYPSFLIPKTGDLTPLAKLGVLFLNSCLTVRAHEANSHSKRGWEQFTTAALRTVAGREDTHIVFLVWGLPAQAIMKTVEVDETRHLVLKSPHPSPLSARRGFFGNEHFKKANEWLEEKYGPGGGIDWTAVRD